MAQEFPYDLDRRYLPLLLPLGFNSRRDKVTIDDTELVARLGLVRIRTPGRTSTAPT